MIRLHSLRIRLAAIILVALTMIPGAHLWALSQTDTLTLEQCYTLARNNYPLIHQRELIDQSAGYSIENASKAYLPQVTLYGSATYQSDVPHIPFELPGNPAPLIPKDQYKVYAELSQVIYDGGATALKKEGQTTESLVKQQGLEVELYKLHERINQLYFGILLIDEQIRQTGLYRKDLELGLRKTSAAIDNGIALQSSADVLRVEILKLQQRLIELSSMRKAYVDMLGWMTGTTPDENTVLITPADITVSTELHRPELAWFDAQLQSLSLQNEQLQVQNRPKISFFLQGGIGRPALNFFDDQLTGYYLGGLKVAWPLAGYYVNKNEQALIDLRRQDVGVQLETFRFNTMLQSKKENEEIRKLEGLLATDDEIIQLRMSIKQSALNQLENGVMTSSDYLREANAEDTARQNKILHDIQLRMARYTLQTTLGN